MTICFCCSISALKVWKNSSWVEILAGDELHVVDHQHVDRAEHLLEAVHVLEAQRRDEAVHELLGGEVEDARLGIVLAHLPGDRVHQVGLAEADAAVEEERVEGDGAAFDDAFRHPAGSGVRELVGLADDEIVEGAAAVERRGGEIHVRAGNRPRTGIGARFGKPAEGGAGGVAGTRRDAELEAADRHAVLAEELPDRVAIGALDPGADEAGGRRQLDDAVHAADEHERVDPVLERVLADLAEQSAAHTGPGFGVGVQVSGHGLGNHLGSSRKGQERGAAEDCPARTRSGAGRGQAPGATAGTTARHRAFLRSEARR